MRLLRHPRARETVRSRAEESILAELHQLAAAGYREVVLSAISLPSYGLDTGTNLVELVEKCAQVPGIERIRLGSLDPDMLTPAFISLGSGGQALPPVPPEPAERLHCHLAPDAPGVHRAGVRTGGGADPRRLRQPPGQHFTTDCICGFPGETAEDFEESCEF